MKLVRKFLQESIALGLPDEAIRNCHAKGLDSIVLRRDYATWKMVRMFVAHHGEHDLDHLYRDDGHFMIGVHDHRYDLRIQVVTGTLLNYTTAPGEGGAILHAHKFHSEIVGGGLAMEYDGEVEMEPFPKFTDIGESHKDGLFMEAERYHTVVVPHLVRQPVTAWLVFEGTDHKRSEMLSPLKMPQIDTEGLYEPMGVKSAEGIVNMIANIL